MQEDVERKFQLVSEIRRENIEKEIYFELEFDKDHLDILWYWAWIIDSQKSDRYQKKKSEASKAYRKTKDMKK